MKILLTTLNSKYVHSNLALKYLYTVAKKAGVDVTLQEFTINNPMEYIYGEIVRGGYDLICFSCYIWNIEKTMELAESIDKALPKAKILLGGPEAGYDALNILENVHFVDYIIRGEGEGPFKTLCEKIASGVSLDDDTLYEELLGFSFKISEGGVVQLPENINLDMAQIPFPYELLEIESDKVVYYETSRGCPYRCSYCLSSIDKSIRSLPFPRIIEELNFFLKKRVKQVKFIDRTFNYDRERAYRIWEYLIRNDNGITNFHFEICGDLLTEKHFELLKTARHGLFQFEIGIQSTYDKALSAVDRKPDVRLLLENVKKLVAINKAHIHVDLIAGLPYEDYDTFKTSFNQVYSLGADNLQLGFLKLLKGTKIHDEAYLNHYEYRANAPYEIISNRWLSALDLIKLKMIEEVLDLYHNKGGFDGAIEYIMAEGDFTPFDLFENLAEYYYREGFQHRSHKKEDLYRILDKYCIGLFGDVRARAEIEKDLTDRMNFDAVKKFHKKGWEI